MKTKRKYKLILFSVMLILIIQNLIVHVTKFGRIPSVNLNPKVTCQVIHNHHQKNYTMTDIPLGKRGDTFIYRVPIPKMWTRRVCNLLLARKLQIETT